MSECSVLVVCGKIDSAKEIASIMYSLGYSNVEFAQSASEARRRLNNMEPAMIIVNSPLADESASVLVPDLSESTNACIIVIVKRELLFELQDDLKKTNALILSKPLEKATFVQTVKFVINTKKSMEELKTENIKLKRKMDETKIIEKSKWYLIENLNMNEQQAHRYIQKRAMDLRMPLVDIAMEIIKNYE